MPDLTDDGANRKAFAARLREAMAGASARSFASRVGVSATAMNQYLNAINEPTRPVLSAMACAAGVRLEWLTTGHGPMRPGEAVAGPGPILPPPLDARLVGRLAEKIMAVYKEMGVAIALHQVAERAVAEHNRIMATGADIEDRYILVGEATAAIRQELQAAAADPASSKHQA